MEVIHERCGRCKCWRLPTEFLNPKGRKLKTCENCRAFDKVARAKSKCEHGKRKCRCQDCGGSQICEHNRRKSTCKDCGGSQICEHKRQKVQCKDCGGSQICEHKIQKSHCKDCGGSQICEHKIQKFHCKECDPNGHLKGIVHRAKGRIDWTDQEHKPAIECLGCDIETYRTYLTDLFKHGMNWENYGDWEIDHIIPLKFENPTFEQAFKRLHYTNTQPLWKTENRSKGNKLTV